MKKNILLSVTLGLLFTISVQAQYYSFGKNRVQYEKFEWRFIQSKHFDVYYYGERNYELAEFAAMSLESAYLQLQEDFDHEISDRLALIIYSSHNDFSQTNVVNLPINAEGIGGVTDKIKNRMTVPFAGDYNDFRRTLHHELVHAVFNDMFYGGNVQSIIQNNIQLVFPLWFEEGLAEYTALGWDTNTDMFIRDAVINNYLPPIQFLSGYYSYRGGQSLWNFIVEEYGREKIAEILNRIRTTRSVEAGLTLSLGLNIEELSDKWHDALKKRYYPEVAERESASSIATLLTRRGDFGTYNTSPAISPQGDKVAFITNSRGYFDITVVSTINGRKLKTLIRGEDNPEFEELNILNPNLAWSPDGRKLALSTKTKGRDDIAIVDYNTRKVEKIKFSNIDAIGSVAWSPDGKHLAFDGNIGPYQDIFIYTFADKKLINITQDFFSDSNPAWAPDSKSVYFVSDRGAKVELRSYSTEFNLLGSDGIYQTDIYQADFNSSTATRITKTPNWNEHAPNTTMSGKLIYISDENGIQNIYEFDPNTRVSFPLTDLQAGVSQMSISYDGSRLAFNSINEGYLDIFLLKSVFNLKKSENLQPNYWASRRALETKDQRVPAVAFARKMFDSGVVAVEEATEEVKDDETLLSVEEEQQSSDNIDFRNYVFSTEVIEDTTLLLKDIQSFDIKDNITEDGRYIPNEYRLNFSLDIAYSPQFTASTFGSYALTQFLVSDLLGDHQLAFGTNFVFDLRNSDYTIQYGNFKNRTNYLFNYFHTSRRFQNFSGELIRYRIYGGGVTIQYPIDKFRRFDFSASTIGVALDYNSVLGVLDDTGPTEGLIEDPNENNFFLYPQITFTNDRTLPGFITPSGGSRYSVGISASPGVGNTAPVFASVLGDFRKYINLGFRYSLALRYSGGTSIGSDQQTYFLGGKLGWINQQWSSTGIPFERLTDSFFSLPAVPLRGHQFNSIYGSSFSLINAEFRFPLFAAVVPGAVPILPFYNITGVAFFDAGTAWGQRIDYGILDNNAQPIVNEKGLDFRVAKEQIGFGRNGQGQLVEVPYLDGDLLLGAGFGLRSIFLGLPFGYDVGWAYDRNGFKSKPIHYISIGIDF